MADTPIADAPLSKGQLLIAVAGAAAVAALIVFAAIIPAEFGKDPSGLGKLTGLGRIWSPPVEEVDVKSGSAALMHEYAAGFRTDTIEIPLTDFLGGASGSELEYKVAMKKDATLIYQWEVVGAQRKDDFHYDFHGHTTPPPGSKERMTVATYKQAYSLSQQGALTAAFDGIQGWQFSNSSDKPVVVKLKLAGFYDLVPGGAEGNLAGIVANVPADQARPGFKPPSR